MPHQHRCWLIITLYMRGVLAGDWSVYVPSNPVCAVVGSSVVFPCSYDYPLRSDETKRGGPLSTQVEGNTEQEYKVLFKMWCLEDSQCITQRYVFHSAGIFPDKSYQNRVQYLGKPDLKDCSLKISDLRESDTGTYIFYLITNHPTEKMPSQSGVQLIVAESPRAVAVSASPSRVLSEGAALRLACCSPAASPQTGFRWYKSTNNTLIHVGKVWNTDAVTSRQSGSYFCQIQDGDKVQNSAMLVVDVQYPPRNTTVSVWFAGGPKYEIPATLICSSDANPRVYKYMWYQAAACVPTTDRSLYRGRQTSAAATGSNSTLSSANISIEEPGKHCCIAQNKHGSQIYTVTIRGLRATPSDSSESKVMLIGVTAGILIVIFASVVFLITRRQRTTRNQSYVLTETTATES